MSTAERIVSIALGILTALGMLVSVTFYFGSLEPRIGGIEEKLNTSLARIDDRNREQDQRLDKIDEGRSIGLQRLSKVEEAVQSTKDALVQINGKLDRVLMRR